MQVRAPSRREAEMLQDLDRRLSAAPAVANATAGAVAVFSCASLVVVEGGSSGFYSAHFEFQRKPTQPIVLTPWNLSPKVKVYPSVLLFKPETAHVPQYFRVTAMENCGAALVAEAIEHKTNSIDPGFSGARVQYQPRTVAVRIVRNDGKHALSTGDATYGNLGLGRFEPTFDFTEIDQAHFNVRNPGADPSTRRVPMLTKVASGGHHTLLLDANDRLFAFGNSSAGQLGLAGFKCSTLPLVWDGLDADKRLHTHVKDVACGGDHSLAFTDDDNVLAWGSNDHGQLGIGALDTPSSDTPRVLQLPLRGKIAQVACGLQHCALLLEEGVVLTWGYGKSGALGHGSRDFPRRDDLARPTVVKALEKTHVFHIACGDMHTAVVSSAGELLTAGWGENGRLGRLEAKDALSSVFERVELKQRRCTYVACGGAHTMLLTDTRDVLAFGANHYGQLGLGDCRDRHRPTPVLFFRRVPIYDLKLGQSHSLAISDDQLLYAWGDGEQGQCGVGSYPQLYTLPHLVRSLVGCGVVQVSAGAAFTVVLTLHSPDAVAQQRLHNKELRDAAERTLAEDIAHREAVRDELRAQHQRRLAQRQHAATSSLAQLWKQLDEASKTDLTLAPEPALASTSMRALGSAAAHTASLQRALQRAVATQRPRSSLACCIGRPRSSTPRLSPTSPPPRTSPKAKTAWFLARRPQTPPPAYADVT
ncbi:regulator of chromosome condensation (RCC1)-like protein [Achlya hypogyna]|uniref:Regulator of chromosome condensation (RCC1)-like protein n=1 Tax=Achlya hypogyna TaxID=1202772 RepID=A0A1V9ZKB0_ACHHY|nr:regulator of chromosome condensation (RCC1)-like protein [Achlya hypogyna]